MLGTGGALLAGGNSGFAKEHRFNGAITFLKSSAACGTGVIVLALLICACAFGESGAETYKAKCSPCHGPHGEGNTMIGKNLKIRSLGSSEVQKQSDEELFNIVSQGKDKMPSYDRKLSNEQIRNVVKYIRSLKK
ncbi:MAG: cytochrome c [Terriglobales bacterium]